MTLNTDLKITVTIELAWAVLAKQELNSNRDVLDVKNSSQYLLSHRVEKVSTKAIDEAITNYKKSLWDK